MSGETVDIGDTGATTQVGGATVTQTYVINEATKFDLIGPGTAQISRGDSPSLTLTLPRSEQEHLEVKLEGDSLKVVHHGGLLRHREPAGPMRYELTVSVLTGLKLSHGLVADAAGIENHDVGVELKDGSSLTMSLRGVAEFDASAVNGGHLTATGSVVKQKVRLAGGSTYEGGGLESDEADIEGANGSEATVRVTRRLKAKATGSSTVSYVGDRIDLSVETSEKSEVRRLPVQTAPTPTPPPSMEEGSANVSTT
jgi:hypothetical protein